LERIFRYAVKKGLAVKNPIQEILEQNPDFFPKPPKGRFVTLTDEELKAIFEGLESLQHQKIDSWISAGLFRDIFLFRLYQGTRIQEALDIQVKEVTTRLIRGEHRSFVYIKPGKTGNERTIPLLKAVEEIVLRNVENKEPEDFLFSEGKRHIKTCQLRRLFDKTLTLADQFFPGLKKKQLRFYDLRHVCLTRMALNGVGDRALGSFAGHRSRKSTDVYVNFADDQLVEAVKSTERSLGRDFAKTLPA
jgi:integrase